MCIYRQSRNVQCLVGTAHLDGWNATIQTLVSCPSTQHATLCTLRWPVQGTSSIKSFARNHSGYCQTTFRRARRSGLWHSRFTHVHALFLSIVNALAILCTHTRQRLYNNHCRYRRVYCRAEIPPFLDITRTRYYQWRFEELLAYLRVSVQAESLQNNSTSYVRSRYVRVLHSFKINCGFAIFSSLTLLVVPP